MSGPTRTTSRRNKRNTVFPLDQRDRAFEANVCNREAENVASSFPIPDSPSPPFQPFPVLEDDVGEETVTVQSQRVTEEEKDELLSPRKTERSPSRMRKTTKEEEHREDDMMREALKSEAMKRVMKQNEELLRDMEKLKESSQRELQKKLNEFNRKKGSEIESLKIKFREMEKAQERLAAEMEEKERRERTQQKEREKKENELKRAAAKKEQERKAQEEEDERRRRGEDSRSKKRERSQSRRRQDPEEPEEEEEQEEEEEDQESGAEVWHEESEEDSEEYDQRKKRKRVYDERQEDQEISERGVQKEQHIDAQIKLRELTKAYNRSLSEGSMSSSLCDPIREDVFASLCRKTLDLDEEGYFRESELADKEVKELKRLQASIIAVEVNLREAVLCSVSETLFGVNLQSSTLTLSEKMKLTALLIFRAMLSQTAVESAVSRALKRERSKTPGVPWERKDILDLKNKDLTIMKLEDIIKVPAVWREYINNAQNPVDARRNLIKALEEKYVRPLKRRKKDKVLTAMGYEAEEILWSIEVLITPRAEVEKSSKIMELHDSMTMHMFERLEGLRVIGKDSIATGVLYFKRLRKEPPSRDKDYESLLEEARKETRQAPRTPSAIGYEFRSLVHGEQSRKRDSPQKPPFSLGSAPPRPPDPRGPLAPPRGKNPFPPPRSYPRRGR